MLKNPVFDWNGGALPKLGELKMYFLLMCSAIYIITGIIFMVFGYKKSLFGWGYWFAVVILCSIIFCRLLIEILTKKQGGVK